MEDDNRSVASAGSVASTSQTKVACPHCAKDFQKRSIFKHIRTNHYKDFLMMTSERWIDEATKGFPLKITWEGKDERGEDDVVTLWVCLATYKTFMSAARANAHFMKDKSSLTIHNRELKSLKKELASAEFKRKQEQANNPVIKAFKEAKERNCPDLARIYWSRLLHEKNAIEMMTIEINKLPEIEDKVKGWLETFNRLSAKVAEMRTEKCLETPILETYMNEFNMIRMRLSNNYFINPSFSHFYSLNSDTPIKYPSQEFTEESYWLTTDRMPKVDF